MGKVIRLSDTEMDRFIALYPEDTILPPRNMAQLMAGNFPSAVRKWLEDEGLLDEQQVWYKRFWRFIIYG